MKIIENSKLRYYNKTTIMETNQSQPAKLSMSMKNEKAS